MSVLQIKKAVKIINLEIEKRQIENFVSEFYEESETARFVNDCITNNKLDYEKMQEYSKDLQEGYINNIINFWVKH